VIKAREAFQKTKTEIKEDRIMDQKDSILHRLLFSDELTQTYIILDGASIPDLLDMIDEYNPLHVCLFRGVEDPGLAKAAPYLVRLEADTPFTGWVLAEGLGKHWGIFALVPEEIPFVDLRKHFRDMVRASLPDGETVLFRYYDPRVCNVFLPTCDREQLREFFGPVNQYLAEIKSEEEEPSEFIEYSFEIGVLQKRNISYGVQG
jgi:hypothetical protein